MGMQPAGVSRPKRAPLRWLVLSRESEDFRQRIRSDPEYYDARIAGWWCWGLCCWIGGGWCTENRYASATDSKPHEDWEQRPRIEGQGVTSWTGANGPNRRPALSNTGEGIQGEIEPIDNQEVPHRRPLQTGSGRSAGVHQLPDLSGDSGAAGRGVHASAGPRRAFGGENIMDQKRPRIGAFKEGYSGTGVNLVNVGNSPLHDDKKPLLNAGGNAVETGGRGIHGTNDQNRPQLADAYSRGRGVHGHDAAGTCDARLNWLMNWFDCLRDRLRTVRVCCGHWKRVCDSPSVTTRLGLTGVFLDPPYPTHAPDGTKSRDGNLYASDFAGDGLSSQNELDKLRDEVLAWCLERGGDKLMRIAVCGYDTDGYAELEAHGWTVVAWKAAGGYGNRSEAGKLNSARERIWFSPHCLDPTKGSMPLFPDH